MVGVHGVLQDFGVLGVVQEGEGVAFGVHRALLQGGVGLAPGHGRGVHAQGRGHGHLHGGVRGAHLEVGQVGHGADGLLGADEVAVAVLAEHDGGQADLVGDLFQFAAQFTLVQGLVEVFLVFGGGDVGQVDGHVGLVEAGHVGGRAGRHVQGAGLGGLGGHPVAAELGVAEDLDADLLVALGFHQFLEFLVAHGDVVARSHGMPQAQGQGLAGMGQVQGGGQSSGGQEAQCGQYDLLHVFLQ